MSSHICVPVLLAHVLQLLHLLQPASSIDQTATRTLGLDRVDSGPVAAAAGFAHDGMTDAQLADLRLRLQRQEEWQRLSRESAVCYHPMQVQQASSRVNASSTALSGVKLAILASRPALVRASLDTWAPHLRKDWLVELAVDSRQYAAHQAEWESLSLPIRTYTTSAGKEPYHRAAEVLLATVRSAAVTAKEEGGAAWFMVMDDDTAINPDKIQQLLDQQRTDRPIILGHVAAGCAPICGGPGIVFNQAALRSIDGDCIDVCRKDMVFGDVGLGAALGANAFTDAPSMRHADAPDVARLASVHNLRTTEKMLGFAQTQWTTPAQAREQRFMAPRSVQQHTAC